MRSFRDTLHKIIIGSLGNNYGTENFDELRFGPYKVPPRKGLYMGFKRWIKNATGYKSDSKLAIAQADTLLTEHYLKLDQLWDHLDPYDRELFAQLFAFRVLGYRKVKLPRNDSEYHSAIDASKFISDTSDTIDCGFMHFVLQKFDLIELGYDIRIYFSQVGVATNYIVEQYAYKQSGRTLVQAETGDCVLDVGGCWGDTALYFAHKAGSQGKVYSFEFIPGNINLFRRNIELNPNLKKRITLIDRPVSDESEKTVYFTDNGPASAINDRPFEGNAGSVETITIDDYIQSAGIQKVDFIKMDIEGAETAALKGALQTIKKHRPKLAIAIYHSVADMINIPNWILSLDLGYEIFIGHYTIHVEETICFAIPKNRLT